ncbi:MAG: hypothetical protein DRJ66_06490 [Thermoprotei archaeon]|nr:MAG: hypothetical protein DRJ66_06490 [Thermoprotei archaeon]
MIDKEIFRSPPKEYKGAPFWSINDILRPEEVRRQVKLMDEGGFGGAFFHAREGLVTPFLSDEWFNSFKVAVNEAKKRGMYIWIYDELRWPSGFAGGLVPSLDERYRAKALVMIIDNIAFQGKEVIATFRCKLGKDGLPKSYEKAKPGEASSEYVYLTFLKYVAPIGDLWYSGFCYVDLLDKQTVRKFIEIAYQPYVKRFKDEIGKTIPGVFTDEPNISSSKPKAPWRIPPRGARFPLYALPWTDELPNRFKELHGYDLLDRLPELFFDIGNYMKTRYDYWKTVTLMFVEAFSKQIYEWCEKYNLKLTGHYLAEDTLISQLTCAGAVMPHYEYMHIPGIDHLGMHIWGTLLTAKQVASVANQLGKERVLCETYGCTGNYPSFEDRKWIGDWLLVMGINFLNHHLVPYSMRGRRKRDFGLNFHWSQPWWRYNALIEDYFTRLSYVLSQGMRVVNVLVIHPIGSVWASYSPANYEKAREIDEQFRSLLRMLLGLHIDFELGDEILMEKYGRVEERALCIGRAKYDVVIIPPCYTLSKNTVKLLSEFIERGGKVIAIKPIPTMVDGEESEEIKKLMKKVRIVEKIAYEDLRKALHDISKQVIIEGDEEGNVLYHLRKVDDSLVLFLCNVSRDKRYDMLKVGIKGRYKVEKWDAFTGEVIEIPAEIQDDYTWLNISLDPVGSLLLVLRPGRPKRGTLPRLVRVGDMKISDKWLVKRHEPNVLVLDYCRVSTGGAWSEPLPVPLAHDKITKKGMGTKYRLRFEFTSDVELRGREVYLVIENPEKLERITVNGVEITKPCGHWIDWNFVKFDISEVVGKGLNTVELEGVVDLEPEIENIYIIGDFGVKVAPKGKAKIIEEPREVKIGDLCAQGYPFYGGCIDLIRQVEIHVPEDSKVYLEMGKLMAALGIIYVNGKEVCKVIGRSPKVEITDYIKEGANEIRVTLVGTLRNVLGPLHYTGGDPEFISPETFLYIKERWTDEYVLMPFGIDDVRVVFYKELKGKE